MDNVLIASVFVISMFFIFGVFPMVGSALGADGYEESLKAGSIFIGLIAVIVATVAAVAFSASYIISHIFTL